MLHRYWFATGSVQGFGVTAYSREDAEALLRAAGRAEAVQLVLCVVEDVDLRDLDANHVRPNMSPPNRRGVWYPSGYSLT